MADPNISLTVRTGWGAAAARVWGSWRSRCGMGALWGGPTTPNAPAVAWSRSRHGPPPPCPEPLQTWTSGVANQGMEEQVAGGRLRCLSPINPQGCWPFQRKVQNAPGVGAKRTTNDPAAPQWNCATKSKRQKNHCFFGIVLRLAFLGVIIIHTCEGLIGLQRIVWRERATHLQISLDEDRTRRTELAVSFAAARMSAG
jgi:hypothetical protein